jgi:enoyl-[acyl-carrier-protein] reductase (NADH)
MCWRHKKKHDVDLKLTVKIVPVTGSTAAEAPEESKGEIEKESFEHVRPSSPLKRFATVDEVGAVAIYLAGELSSATNGAALRVDGGVVGAIL